MSRAQYYYNNSWNDAHFYGLKFQVNVYSLSKVTLKNKNVKILAGSIDGHLASVQFAYQSSFDKLVPITTDDVIMFDSVLNRNNSESAGETELVSMDVVDNWNDLGSNALAVTFLKLGQYDEHKAPEAFMNIYQLDEAGENSLVVSKTPLQNLNLDFIPFKLYHHRILLEDGSWETQLLLSGNDHKIHVYQPMGNKKGYQEVNAEKLFPEFSGIDDCVTQLEIKQVDTRLRLTSYGTQNGAILLFLVNVESKEILDSWTTDMDSPITSLHFFYQHSSAECPDFLKMPGEGVHSKFREEEEEDALNLLVTSALDSSTVYNDIMTNGFAKCRSLPDSNSQDVVLCSCVMDVDFDGENEILIGTYGKMLMVYKLYNENPQVYSSTPFHSPMPVPIHSDTPILSSEGEKHNHSIESNDKQDKDVRRRHKSMAATVTDTDLSSTITKNDKQKTEEYGMETVGSQQTLKSRFFRSQENLASPSTHSVHYDTPDHITTPDLTIPNFAMAPTTDLPSYKLIWTRCFCNPVKGLACDDVMGDGMMDMVVLTLKGLHILQPDLQEVATLVQNRLQLICDSHSESHNTDKQTHADRGL